MIKIDYNGIEDFVKTLVRRGVDARWDGWDVVIFNKDPQAMRSKFGVWHDGFGFESRISPGSNGYWHFKREYVGN